MRNLRLKWAWQPGSMNLGPQQPPVRTPFPRCPPQPAMAPTVTGSSTPVLSHLNTLIVDMRPTVHGHLSPPGVPQPQLRLMGSGGFRSHHQNPPVEPCAVLPRTAYCVPPVCSVTSLVAHQVPLSMGFSRQEYWSGLSFSPSGDLPNLGTELASLVFPALAGGFFTVGTKGLEGKQSFCIILGNSFSVNFISLLSDVLQ